MSADGEGKTFLPLGKAVFIEDVAKYLKEKGQKVEEVIFGLQQQLQQYKMIEAEALQRRQRQQLRLPEIQMALDAVKGLQSKKDSSEELTVDYELADGVFACAAIQEPETVNLWLGAGTMVEMQLDEAASTLDTNLAACKQNIDALGTELELLKASITTTEVNMARLFNYDVEQRRSKKAAGSGS